MKRRGFLAGLVGLVAAPAVVAAKDPVPAVDWRPALPVVGPSPMTASEVSMRMQEYIRSALPVFESIDTDAVLREHLIRAGKVHWLR